MYQFPFDLAPSDQVTMGLKAIHFLKLYTKGIRFKENVFRPQSLVFTHKTSTFRLYIDKWRISCSQPYYHVLMMKLALSHLLDSNQMVIFSEFKLIYNVADICFQPMLHSLTNCTLVSQAFDPMIAQSSKNLFSLVSWNKNSFVYLGM